MKILLVGLLFIFTFHSVQAKIIPITTSNFRKKVLDEANEQLNKVPPYEITTLASAHNPFLQLNLASSESTASEGKENPSAELDPQIALKRIAERLIPSGILEQTGHYLLILSGATLNAGDTFDVTLAGHTYTIKLYSVSENSFTLQYKNVLITRGLEI